MALSVDTTPAKHVTVLRNGDGKFGGRKFIISRRRYRTFDSLLSDITHQISAPFGAVRRLYTPKGSRQIQGIDDLEGGATYVAGGTERFKRIEYVCCLHYTLYNVQFIHIIHAYCVPCTLLCTDCI